MAAMVNASGRGQGNVTIMTVSEAAADLNESSREKSASAKSISDAPAARIDDSPSPSIGLVCWKCNRRRNDGEILLGIGMLPG